jgi:hypothetical protein
MTEQEMQLQIAIEQGKVNTLRQEVAEMNKEREYWQHYRIHAAIAAMNIVKGAYNVHNDMERLVRHSVKLADALVAELKKGGEQ